MEAIKEQKRPVGTMDMDTVEWTHLRQMTWSKGDTRIINWNEE